MHQITSRANPRIKQVRALRQRKARQKARLFLVEGIRHVGEAVQANASIEELYYSPELLTSGFGSSLIEKLSKKGVESVQLSADLFNHIADKENPQGILAVVRQSDDRLEEIEPESRPWIIALASPQDPGNVGSILRTVDAAGADGLVLVDSNLDPYHPALVRASMGTLFWYPLVQASIDELRNWAARWGYHIYGSSAHADLDYLQAKPYMSPRVLLLGSEREGLTENQRQICERIVRLPMKGHSTSLNLSVAAGVLMYAMLE